VNWTAVNLKSRSYTYCMCTTYKHTKFWSCHVRNTTLALRSVMNWTAVNLKSVSYTYWVHYIQTSKFTLEHDLSAKIGNKLNWTPVNLKSISYTYWVEHTDIKIYLKNTTLALRLVMNSELHLTQKSRSYTYWVQLTLKDIKITLLCRTRLKR